MLDEMLVRYAHLYNNDFCGDVDEMCSEENL